MEQRYQVIIIGGGPSELPWQWTLAFTVSHAAWLSVI